MIDARDAALMREIVRDEVARGISSIEPRMSAAERNAAAALHEVERLRDDLYGDPARRSGPASLYERLDRIDAAAVEHQREIIARLETTERTVRRWRATEKALGGLIASGAWRMARRVLPPLLITASVIGFYLLLWMYVRV